MLKYNADIKDAMHEISKITTKWELIENNK